ncbi:phage tail tape measure protein [Nocardioides sp. QY071]|uniref:phage tail tape measure protein n=1 Tax=Nocardioides sp. QY071 TaxID=3044187 RepID=UPI00249C2B08|nr:phage tail tape measure protein [Nocardioides sp. QY071]WGY03728.1 phage tail tape measure protein [Nocardioides sp. QY071]
MAGPVRIAILANGSQARRELAQVQGSLGRLQASAVGAAKLGVGALALGAGALAKSAIDAERQFSTSMRLIQANTSATSAEMDKLNKLAIQLGADTSFSASEAADAMLELAKAGIDTKTIMGGGLAGTLQLAAAGGTDLATASTIASNALNTFHLAGKDMASIAAALAGGANASTASVESLGLALQQVGPGATNAGLSLQETVAALAAFDAAGIKGSDAGTSLKTMLARLVPTSKQAATAMDQLGLDFVKGNGQFESLANIAGQLQAKLGGLSQAQRTQALTTIFGSDASRAATVLMNEGTVGLRKFIKATKDQDAAQEAAAARMSGTEGALERLSGAAETAKLRLGQELAPAVTKGADLLGDKLVPAMDRTIDVAKDIGRALGPAARELGEALGHLGSQGDEAGAIFEDVLLPALETTSEVVGGLVDFIDDLPGPIKSVGLQAGIAALVFPRFAAGVSTATTAMSLNIAKLQQLRAEMTYTATRAQVTSAAMTRLSGAAKTAAGVGGMVALTQGAQESNQALKDLYSVAGGALAGSAFGPWGAVIGGVGGALAAVAGSSDTAKDAVRASSEAARTAIGNWEDYASTLDQVTGSITRQTRVEAAQRLQKTEAFDLARKLGISTRDLVNASLGQEKASARVQAALEAEMYTTSTYVDQLGNWHTTSAALNTDAAKLSSLLGIQSAEVATATAKTQEQAIATGELRAQLEGVSSRSQIVTRIESRGWPKAEADVYSLLRGIDLTPEQIKTTIKALGVGGAIGDVDRFAARLRKVDNVKVNLKGWVSGIQTAINEGASISDREKKLIVKKLNAIAEARPDLAPYVRSVKKSVNNAKTEASASTRVGEQLKQGLLNGMAGTGPALSAIMSSAVRHAIDAAKAEAKTHSPSRETMWVGRMLGEGLAVGMDSTAAVVARGGVKISKSAIAGLLVGVTEGSAGVDEALEKITKLIERRVKGKGQEKREKKILKGLKDQFDQLKANGKAQDDLISGDYLKYLNQASALYQGMTAAGVRNLEEAQDHLADLKRQAKDYADTISNTIKATGDITQLGRVEALTEKQLDELKKTFANQPETLARILASEGSGVSLDLLLNQLGNAANDADQFAYLTEKLAKMGLKQTAIDQILAAGPAAALATAEAIDVGGESAVKQINELQDRLDATGTRLGKQMSDRYYQTGVDAAQGLVRGMESEMAHLEAVAMQMADALAIAARAALQIKSPSRVFMGIGDDVMQGLNIGIDDTVASRAGARAALSLTEGFGNPALDATATWTAMSKAERSREIKVRFTADQVSILQQGREIQMKLDYARSNGVTGTTF